MEKFEADWLALREPFDARARSRRLAAHLAAALPAAPRIMDLGAGTGALLRWLAPVIGRAQAWTLVDADAALLDHAMIVIARDARRKGWRVTARGRDGLIVHASGGDWLVRGLVADLRHAPDNLPLDGVDAVVNTALCDLVSEAWIARMARALAGRGLAFYSALNVDGRDRFMPPHRDDGVIARGFARDQARDKGFGGIALGAGATGAIGRHFTGHGYAVRVAASPWVIGRRDRVMAGALAAGHGAAALGWERRGAVGVWVDARRRQAGSGGLAMRVGHADSLALPPTR